MFGEVATVSTRIWLNKRNLAGRPLGHDVTLMEQDLITHGASGRRHSLDAMLLLMLTFSAAAKRVMLSTSLL